MMIGYGFSARPKCLGQNPIFLKVRSGTFRKVQQTVKGRAAMASFVSREQNCESVHKAAFLHSMSGLAGSGTSALARSSRHTAVATKTRQPAIPVIPVKINKIRPPLLLAGISISITKGTINERAARKNEDDPASLNNRCLNPWFAFVCTSRNAKKAKRK